jgi:hypothetical protein
MNDLVPHLAEIAEKINAEHAQALDHARASITHARNAGVLLLEAKKRWGHGQWLPWLEANVQFSERTAQAYMRVAKRWPELEAKAQATADLTIEDGLKLLASPKTETIAEKAIPLPDLKPGMRYSCLGRDKHKVGIPCLAEIDPHPDHPGFWVCAFYFLAGDGSYVEYCGRGVALTREFSGKKVLSSVLEASCFEPTHHWHEEPAKVTEPSPVFWYREDYEKMFERP